MLEIVTDFRMLMQNARALAEAERGGDEAEIARAQDDPDAYRDLCLKSDRVVLGISCGAL